MTNGLERTIDLGAPLARVWQALTDYREFGHWFRVALDGPFILGGVTTGRMTYPGYEHFRWYCTVTRMEPRWLFAFTWPHSENPADQEADLSKDPTTLVEFHLSPIETGTRLLIRESGFDAIPAARRMEVLRGNEGGWIEQSKNIRCHVEN
jgi:uncharacterized protein YndB with AHSA1/START domain